MKLDHDTALAVRLAAALVNTRDAISGEEKLTGTAGLRALLRAHEVSYGVPDGPGTLDQARELRERLRPVFGAAEPDAVARLNALVAEARALPQLVNHDGTAWHFHYVHGPQPWHQALAADLGMGLLVVIRDFGADRLGVCAGADCADVYVDTSRNASKLYCSSRTCGNRASVQAYRRRQAQTGDR